MTAGSPSCAAVNGRGSHGQTPRAATRRGRGATPSPREPRRPKPPGRERKTADPSAGRYPLEPRLDAETGAARVERVHDGRHLRAPGIAVDGLGESDRVLSMKCSTSRR